MPRESNYISRRLRKTVIRLKTLRDNKTKQKKLCNKGNVVFKRMLDDEEGSKALSCHLETGVLFRRRRKTDIGNVGSASLAKMFHSYTYCTERLRVYAFISSLFLALSYPKHHFITPLLQKLYLIPFFCFSSNYYSSEFAR